MRPRVQAALDVTAQQRQLPQGHQGGDGGHAPVLGAQPGPGPDLAEESFVHDSFQVGGQKFDAGQGVVTGVSLGHLGPLGNTLLVTLVQ
ncbi:MAG: hypothetical protein CMA85_03170 [Euryarchaeota archaeon]|nr:hypothetical protein [Euryarchaeota archaeon]